MGRWRVLVTGVGIALVAGCSGGGDGGDADESSDPEPTTSMPEASDPTDPSTVPEPTPAPRSDDDSAAVLPDVVGLDLQLAQDTMQAAGFYVLISHDATDQGRNQVLDRNWTVCDQSPAPGTATAPDTVIDFGAVKDDEPCP